MYSKLESRRSPRPFKEIVLREGGGGDYRQLGNLRADQIYQIWSKTIGTDKETVSQENQHGGGGAWGAGAGVLIYSTGRAIFCDVWLSLEEKAIFR